MVHPWRLVARQDFKAITVQSIGKMKFATVRKGDSFWVLNVGGEGEFKIWWHCRTAGWDSTEPYDVDDDRLALLGTNEEGWVKIRDPKTGLSGWFKDIPTQDDPKLVPAHRTVKSTG